MHPPAPLAANRPDAPLMRRIRAKVRLHAKRMGHTGPAPLILIDADQSKAKPAKGRTPQ